jgi:large subunit ribosomal protein L10
LSKGFRERFYFYLKPGFNLNLINMATTRKQKEESLSQIQSELKSAKGAVFTEYRGMTVKSMNSVRKALKKENVIYRVVKVTLLKKALAALGVNADELKYSGPVAVAISKDEETAPARLLKGMTKENPMLIFDGGLIEQKLVDSAMIERLALLPGKQQLQSQLVGVIAGPARGLVTVLSGNARGLLNVLKAAAEKK